jgi:hypothetical protein
LCHNFAYESLSFFGVNRNIRSGWRYLPTAFGGCGLFSLSTECVIARLNLLLQHWLAPSTLGESLSCSMEYLQLEAGFAACPLSEPFEPLGPLCTHSWVRSLWESVQAYNLDVDLEYPSILPPRKNDVLLSTISVSSGLRGAALESFRRCRVASHALYLSCLASANGRALDPTRGQPGVDYSTSTTYDFPKERPSVEDWATWRQFWQQYCLPDGSLPRSLGKWRHPTHRTWEWFYDEPSDVVYR